MPYKASGKTILVKRRGRWVVYRQAANPAAAKKEVKALNINVGHNGKKKSKNKR